MKVIDERGRLFGKLNVIDLLVVVLLIAALAVVGMKSLGGEQEAVAAAKLTYTVRVTGQRPEVAQRMSEYVDKTTGRTDQLMAGTDCVDGCYVVDYWTEPTQFMKSTDGTMVPYEPAEGEEGDLVDLCFVIEAAVTNVTLNQVGSQEVRIGKSHIVKTVHFEFTNGTVENCTWEIVG